MIGYELYRLLSLKKDKKPRKKRKADEKKQEKEEKEKDDKKPEIGNEDTQVSSFICLLYCIYLYYNCIILYQN